MLFILILIGSLILQFFLPWWIIAPVAFIFSYWRAGRGAQAFGSAFGAIFVLWVVMALLKTWPNDNILANRVGQLLGLPDLAFNWLILLLITGIIGGLVAGFAALAGFYFKPSKTK